MVVILVTSSIIRSTNFTCTASTSSTKSTRSASNTTLPPPSPPPAFAVVYNYLKQMWRHNSLIHLSIIKAPVKFCDRMALELSIWSFSVPNLFVTHNGPRILPKFLKQSLTLSSEILILHSLNHGSRNYMQDSNRKSFFPARIECSTARFILENVQSMTSSTLMYFFLEKNETPNFDMSESQINKLFPHLGHVYNFFLHHWNRNLHGLLNMLMMMAS